MEPPEGVEPSLCAYRAHTLLSVGGKWCQPVESNHVLWFFRPALNLRTSSVGEGWSQRADSNRHELLTGQPCFRYITPAWSTGEDSRLRFPLIGRAACYWTTRGEMVLRVGFEPTPFRLKGGHAVR